MCKHILVIKHADGGKHTIKECVDGDDLKSSIDDAKSKPGTIGYEVFNLGTKVVKATEWRDVPADGAPHSD